MKNHHEIQNNRPFTSHSKIPWKATCYQLALSNGKLLGKWLGKVVTYSESSRKERIQQEELQSAVSNVYLAQKTRGSCDVWSKGADPIAFLVRSKGSIVSNRWKAWYLDWTKFSVTIVPIWRHQRSKYCLCMPVYYRPDAIITISGPLSSTHENYPVSSYFEK